MILNIGGGGGLPIRLIVTAPTGSAVSVTQGATVLAANEVDGVWTFAIPSLGVWTIHATIEGQSLTQDVDISKVGQYNVTLEAPIKSTLNDNDWATIKSVADESKGPNYWAVGDTKQIVINGKLSDGLTLSNYSTWVYIIGFDHNKDVEGTGIAFCGFKSAQTGGGDICLTDSGYYSSKTSGQWFNINNLESNAGGWASCLMRTATIPAFRNTLPADLLSVIKTTNIYTDNVGGGGNLPSSVTATQDDIYLLAEWEIGGMRSDANSAEQNYQKQYAYYAAGNSRIRGNQGSASDRTDWWERSPYGTQTLTWCLVGNTGTLTGVSTKFCGGFAPAFKVGGAKYTPLDYITATGTQYIDTGLIVNKSDSYRMVLDTDLTSSENYAGCNGYMQFQANVGEGTRSTIDITYKNITETITVNGTQKSSQSWSSYSGANVKLGIFKMGDANNTWFNGAPQSGKLYSCKIYKDDVLVRDMIPAKDEVGNAGLYDKIEGKFYYNAGTGSFKIPGTRTIDSVSVGQSVYCNVNDTKTEFIIVHQGKPSSMYDDSCNGTWLLMKDIYEERQWNSSTDNIYGASTIHSYLNSTFLNRLDIKDVIKQVKIPYVNGWGGSAVASGANGLSTNVFLLSGYEVGLSGAEWVPQDGARLSYFNQNAGKDAKRIAYLYGSTTDGVWWLRSARTDSNSTALVIVTDGAYSYPFVNDTKGVRPAFIVPSDTYIDEDNNILTSSPYNAISTLNVGDSVFFNVGGVKTEYVIVHKGNPNETIYDSSCDGVWAVCKNIPNNSLSWRSMPYVIYSDSLARSWPNTTYYNTIDSGIKQYIKTAKLPYTTYSGGNFVSYNMANGMEQNCFLLSWVELGGSVAYPNTNRSSDGATLSYFNGQPNSIRIAKYGNNAIDYWTRSVWKSGEDMALAVSFNGDGSNQTCTTQIGMRPALIFDNNTPIDSSNNIIA